VEPRIFENELCPAHYPTHTSGKVGPSTLACRIEGAVCLNSLLLTELQVAAPRVL
jgi:hypothetical protein